eukprot:5044301-Amphidinium_carterae.1
MIPPPTKRRTMAAVMGSCSLYKHLRTCSTSVSTTPRNSLGRLPLAINQRGAQGDTVIKGVVHRVVDDTQLK